MVGTTLKMRMDENANERQNALQAKKLVAPTINETTTKRAALGELQNRGVLRAVQSTKDAALQKDTKDLKFQANLRNAKSRVDTHWKKPVGTNNNAAANAAVAVTAKTTTTTAVAAATKSKSVTTLNNGAGGADVAQRRVLMRSNSVRLGTTSGIGLNRQVSANALQIGKATTTTTTNVKVVDTKVIAAAAIEKPAKKSDDAKPVAESTATLRREDSNLSRKSLTKLRAALTAKPAIANKPQINDAVDATKKGAGAAAIVPADSTKATATAAVMPIPKKVVGGNLSVHKQEEAKGQSTHSNKRLEGVEDIDADDQDNLVLVAEYVNEIYDYLYTVEATQCIRKNHLDGQTEVHSKMRSVLIDWINEVHVQFHLAGETFHMAVAIIDLYLQVVKDTKRLHLQLVGVTALFIATKYEELFPPAIADFVYITDDTYTSRQIRLMELEILKALDFTLSRPLPIHFLRRYSKAAGAEDAHHAMSKYFLELASIEYDLASYKPSEIAAASLFLSLHLLNDNAKAGTGFNNKHWNKTLQYYSCYTPDHLRPISRKIAAVARNAPHAKLKSVYTKYQTNKFQKIAMRPELYGALMDSIVNQ